MSQPILGNNFQPLLLTGRFTQAVEYARELHTECRKGTSVPYMAHLLGVASLVMGEHGYLGFPVTEEIVVAALLHDVVEDHGGLPRLQDVERTFGPSVARMVKGCTDSFASNSEEKEDWDTRKVKYLERLRQEEADTRLISAADKLYNARAILDDYRAVGSRVWERFKRPREKQLWHFRELHKVYEAAGPNRIVQELGRVIAELERISA